VNTLKEIMSELLH